MVRRVFFSFHYDRDVWRAWEVRNSWVTKEREAAGFWDASLEEEAKTKGNEVIKRMIDEGLKNTSVTAVLIGAETFTRQWVKYEIKRSYEKGKGLLGIYIQKLKNKDGNADVKGDNPFNYVYVEEGNKKIYFSKIYPTYDMVDDDGYSNFGYWVEKAAERAGR